MLQIIQEGRLDQIQEEMINMLEKPVMREYPILQEIKEKILVEGAMASAMSGSGPTVYGLFREEKTVRAAYAKLRSTLPYRYQVICTQTENPRYQIKGEWK